MVKKFGDCENTHSVNPLYLILHSATGHFKEKNDKKYLILDLAELFYKKIMLKLELILTMIYL